MKSFFKKLAFVMALAMVVTLAAPAAQAALAASVITYAYQEGGEVAALNLKAGDTQDLKFIGAPKDWKTVGFKWESTNPAVATVDKTGLVTAVADGTATITCTIGDSTTKGVAVTVGATATKVVLGTSKNDTFSAYTLELGKTVDLGFYGVVGYSADKYSCAWASNDDKVATVNNKGLVTPVSAGTATITVAIVDKATGAALEVVPVVVTVPVVEASKDFTAVQTSDTVATLTFKDATVSKTALETGLKFYYYIGDVQIAYPISVTSVKDGVATLTSYTTFVNGTTYGFEFNSATAEFEAAIGDVASLDVSYACSGDSFKAYAGAETTLTVKLLNAKGVDITASALAAGGSVLCTLVEESESGDFWLSDASGKVYFNAAGKVAKVKVEYNTGKYDETTYEPIAGPSTIVPIVSTTAPAYAINVAAGATATIGDAASVVGSSFDWSKANTVIALGDEAAAAKKLVVKLADNKGNKVYSDDTTGANGTFSLATTNNAVLYVAADGTLMTNAAGTVNVLVYFTATGATSSSVVGVVPVTVRPARAVTYMAIDKTSDVVSTESPYNTTSFKITLTDQLNAKIDGSATVTCNTKNLPAGATAFPLVDATVNTTSGEGTITVVADIANLPTNANGFTYTYTVKCGNLVKSFSITIRKPITGQISGHKIEIAGASDLKTEDDLAKAFTATLYQMSNGVKYAVAQMTQKPAAVTDMNVGDYYYVVTKGGSAITAAENGDDITVPLTNIVNDGVANIVKKDANGVGSYTIIVYKGVGTTNGATASAFTQVASTTFIVKDTQDAMAYAGKTTNGQFATIGTSVEDIVMNCFKFTLGSATLDEAADYGTTRIVVNANVPATVTAGAVCYVKSVDFYVLVGTNTYVKYTVNVNDYVQYK